MARLEMRDESVTISKALGIMLMVLAHSGFSCIGDAAINMFHMPLFFFMSGYCFSDRHLIFPKSFMLGKIKTVYFPYIKYSLFFLVLHNVFCRLQFYKGGYYSLHDIIFQASRIFMSMGLHDQLLGGYWFMGNLFWGLIITFMFLKYCRNNAIVGIIISLAISIIMNIFDFLIPVIRVGFSDFFSAAFILTGVFYKRKDLKFELKPYTVLPIACILVVLGTIYWRGCVPEIVAWKILPYYITAITGTLAIFSISKIIVYCCRKRTFVNKIGGGTFAILTWHFLCFKFVSWMIIVIYKLPLDTLAEFPVIHEYANNGWWVVYFLIGVMLPLGIDWLIRLFKESLIILFK